jgi:glycosyltransferase involved in cell wall biosynthesis
VSVVVPAYNHARYVERAIASALAQTWRDLEIVVVDDGSSDATADVAARTLAAGARPHRIVRRANRGAPRTLNEGAALATGEYVQFLNSDDWLEPTRVERMVDEVAGVGAGWGYSAVSLVDGDGAPVDVMKHRRAFDLMLAQSAIGFRLSVGFSLVPGNTAVSTGNLFVARAFLDRIGGFREFRWNHDWDFALRATWLEEPVFVDAPLYAYRLHAPTRSRRRPTDRAPRWRASPATTSRSRSTSVLSPGTRSRRRSRPGAPRSLNGCWARASAVWSTPRCCARSR